MLVICMRACRSTHRRRLSSAMLATEQPRRLVSRRRGRRFLGPDRESRNSRDDGFASRGRGERPLGPDREGRSGSDAAAASGTDQGNGEGPPAILSGRAAHELSSWGRLPPTVIGRTRGQSQRLQDESAQRQRVIEEAISAALQKWTEFGSILANTSWTTRMQWP